MNSNNNIKMEKIKHDIKNLRSLTKEQIIYLCSSSNQTKTEIFELYNDMFTYLNENIDGVLSGKK